MKIQKIALSILAIAISSSVFASSYPEQIQNIRQEFQAELNSSSYDAVTENAARNIYGGLKGSQTNADPKNASILTFIKSNGNSVHSYKVYSEEESKAVKDLYDKLSESGLSDDILYTSIQSQLDESRKSIVYQVHDDNKASQSEISKSNALASFRNSLCEGALKALKGEESEIERFNNIPSEISEGSVRNTEAFKKSMVVSSCFEINPTTHKVEAIGLKNDDARNVLGYNAKIDNFGAISEMAKRGLVGSLSFAPSEIQKFKDEDSSLQAQYAAASKDIIENNLNLDLDQTLAPMGSAVSDVFLKFANEYKAKENAKAISEFNALQEIALKEPDLAVKSLIKQAADLKLASYAK